MKHDDNTTAARLCASISEDAASIAASLNTMGDSSLPLWWNNKLAICYAYMNSLRDYAYFNMTSHEPEEAEEDDNEDSYDLKIGDYAPKHFDICPSAVALYANITDKTDMIHLVVESAMLHDLFFKLEKFAIAMGVADQDVLNKAQHYADLIMSLANEMGLASEHSYIQDVHMANFKNLAIDTDMIPPSARSMNRAAKAG